MKNEKNEKIKQENLNRGEMKKADKGFIESAMIKKANEMKINKILLVEDTEKWKERISAGLVKEGKTVLIASTLEEAKKLFDENNDIDLVITDMSYPERAGAEEDASSGMAFIMYVKAKRPDLKVIAQSSDPGYLNDAKKAGADEMINKSDIVNRINKLMGKYTKESDEGKKEKAREAKEEKQKEIKLLIITSHENFALALKRAVQEFVPNATVIDYCKPSQASKKFSPEKYTHVIATDDYLSCEEKDVKCPQTQNEAWALEAQGFKLEREIGGGMVVHTLRHMDIDENGKYRTKMIILTEKIEDYRFYHHSGDLIGKYNSDKTAVLKNPPELKDIIRLLSE